MEVDALLKSYIPYSHPNVKILTDTIQYRKMSIQDKYSFDNSAKNLTPIEARPKEQS